MKATPAAEPTPDSQAGVPAPAAATPTADPNAPASWPEWFRAVDVALALLVLVPAFLVASFAARNGDLWVHLASGRLIANGGYKFGVDPFSYATEGRTWVNHSWLFDLVSYLLYSKNPSGTVLVAGKAIGFTAAIGLLLLIRRPGHSLWPWAVFAALAVLAAAPTTSLRPMVASAVFLAGTVYVLLGTNWRRGSWRNPLILGVMFCVWANVDTWFVLGPLAVALVLVGEWLHKMVIGPGETSTNDAFAPPPHLLDLAKALGIGVVACMLNPHHALAWQLPPELGFGLPPAVVTDEYYFPLTLSPLSARYTGNPLFGYNVNGAGYGLLLLLGGVALVAGFGSLRLSHLLLWLAFAFLSLVQYRLILFFAVVAVPIAAGCVNGVSARIRLGPKSRPATRVALTLSGVGRILTVPALLIMAAAAWPGWLHPRPSDPTTANRVAWVILPDPAAVRTADMIQKWRASGRLPAEFRGVVLSPELANYFAWFAPGEKVLANSRYTFHADELPDLVAARKALRGGPPGEPLDVSALSQVCRHHRATFVVAYADGGPSRSIELVPLLQMVYGGDEWQFWNIDGRSAVLGWRGAISGGDAGAFAGLTFDPVRLAFDPAQKPIPEPKVTRPTPQAEEWWEEFTQAPAPIAPDTLDALLWAELARHLRTDSVQRYQATWWTAGAAVASVPGVAPFVAFRRLPSPAADEAQMSLQLMAIRAARRAAAENPDQPDPYHVLARTAGFTDLAVPGQDPRDFLFQQVAGYRQFLDRLPPPERANATVAKVGLEAASVLCELYRHVGLTADLFPQRPIGMADLYRDTVKLASEYAKRVADSQRDPEMRKRYLDEATRQKNMADANFSRRNEEYETFLKTRPRKTVEKINYLLHGPRDGQSPELVGRAIQVFRDAVQDNQIDNELRPLVILMVRLKLRAGFVAEAADDIAALDESFKDNSPTDPRSRGQYALQIKLLQQELWRVTGNYPRLTESYKADAPPPLTPEARKQVATVVAAGQHWQALVGGQHGAIGGSLGYLSAFDMTGGFIPMPVNQWATEVRFYNQCGVWAVLEGDIPTAKARFAQAAQGDGVQPPPGSSDRALAEFYLRLIAAAEKAGK